MKRIGDVLLALGLVVGIGAIVGYEMDIIPTLPPAVLKLVLYKLIFAGGVGLLVAGGFIRRLGNREAGGGKREVGGGNTAELTDPRETSRPRELQAPMPIDGPGGHPIRQRETPPDVRK